MKTPEEIKRDLIDYMEDASCVTEYGDAHDLIDSVEKAHETMADALSFIRRLEQDNAQKDERIRKLEQGVPHWISVEERLPEDGVNVLVYGLGNNENSTIAMTSYTHRMYGYDIEGWCSPWQYFFHEYKITHWMPLPEPPEEDAE